MGLHYIQRLLQRSIRVAVCLLVSKMLTHAAQCSWTCCCRLLPLLQEAVVTEDDAAESQCSGYMSQAPCKAVLCVVQGQSTLKPTQSTGRGFNLVAASSFHCWVAAGLGWAIPEAADCTLHRLGVLWLTPSGGPKKICAAHPQILNSCSCHHCGRVDDLLDASAAGLDPGDC